VRHHGCPCLVISGQDVVFHVPRAVTLRLKVGDRVSLFPIGQITGKSRGLHWPIDGLHFATEGRIGTSNMASHAQVDLQFDQPGMLVILPRARLDAAISALVPKWRGPHRAPRGVRGG
jgi:thiamine pyrophosphokinase